MQKKSTRWQQGDSGVPRPGQRWQRHRGDRGVQTPHDSRWLVFVFVFVFVVSVFVFVLLVVFALAFVFKSSLFYLLIINPQATCSLRRRWWCWSTPPTRTATEVSTFRSSWKSWCDTWSGQKVKIRSDQSWTKQLPKNHNERTLHNWCFTAIIEVAIAKKLSKWKAYELSQWYQPLVRWMRLRDGHFNKAFSTPDLWRIRPSSHNNYILTHSSKTPTRANSTRGPLAPQH